MSALRVIQDEAYRVYHEVLSRRNEKSFAIFYGRLAGYQIRIDPRFFQMCVYSTSMVYDVSDPLDGSRLMGFRLISDYGLPDYAVAFHAGGKPYTTISVDPEDLKARLK